MSETTLKSAAPAAAGLAFIPQEQALCLGCDGVIPRQNVIAQIRRDNLGATVQRVRAWCEHCKTMFELHRQLRGGVWQMAGEVEIVTDANRRATLLRRMAAQRGEVEAS